jgi:hypothetical protein
VIGMNKRLPESKQSENQTDDRTGDWAAVSFRDQRSDADKADVASNAALCASEISCALFIRTVSSTRQEHESNPAWKMPAQRQNAINHTWW